jgi:uncharacterized membrane protein
MDLVLGVLGFVLLSVWFALTAWLSAVGLLAGACAVLFAVHMVLVQPKKPRNHVGMSAQVIALVMAVPIATIGIALIAWLVSRADA